MTAKKKAETPSAESLQQRIGYQFQDLARLEGALTHVSARPAGGTDYQRLEFLGDRVLGLVIADWLYEDHPKAAEGEMSVRLNALVNAETLSDIAEEIGLSQWIKVGKELRGVSGRKRVNMRSDVMEALIAAIYLDGGFEPARRFIRANWKSRAAMAVTARRDAKTELQEWAHQNHSATPAYKVAERSGPDHDPVFVVAVIIPGLGEERGKGRSKREAEQAAAKAVLIREKVWADDKEQEND